MNNYFESPEIVAALTGSPDIDPTQSNSALSRLFLRLTQNGETLGPSAAMSALSMILNNPTPYK